MASAQGCWPLSPAAAHLQLAALRISGASMEPATPLRSTWCPPRAMAGKSTERDSAAGPSLLCQVGLAGNTLGQCSNMHILGWTNTKHSEITLAAGTAARLSVSCRCARGLPLERQLACCGLQQDTQTCCTWIMPSDQNFMPCLQAAKGCDLFQHTVPSGLQLPDSAGAQAAAGHRAQPDL